MAARDPDTPGCAIAGCPRAARQLGLCRPHRARLPLRFGARAAVAAMAAAHDAAKPHRERARRTVEAILAAERDQRG